MRLCIRVRTLYLRNGRSVDLQWTPCWKADMAGVAVVAVVALARGHGSVIMPPSRNSIDATLPPWSNGNHPETGLIESVNLCILHPLTPLSPSPTVAKKWGVRVEANPLARSRGHPA
jgi:hypothetical protein